LSDPWHTTFIAAPLGTDLGMHALMPLAGIAMLPVTLIFGPSAAYNLLSVMLPGLLAYAMYRLARLWVPSQTGAIASGAFFGFSAMLDFQTWVHLNLAVGAIFLPLTLEAAVRLRRRPGPGQAIILGTVLGASLLVDQESAVLALIVALLAIGPWLLSMQRSRYLLAGLAGLVAVAVAGPQLVAIVHANLAGSPPSDLDSSAYLLGIKLPDMFLASPRVASFGLGLGHAENASTYGLLPTLLALTGLVLAWRRRSARLLALMWLAAAALALGADLIAGHGRFTPVAQLWHGVEVSLVLPFTWFARIPGLSGFREPSRIAELGLIPMALLAGFTVSWLRYHARYLLVVVFVLGVFEAGLTTPPNAVQTMPTGLPALDQPIAADHSRSVVLDIPFGLRGGTGISGLPFSPETQVLATADGHPLADALLSRVPTTTRNGINAEPFYADLISVQTGHHQFTPAQVLAASQNAVRMDIGWVLLWVANKHLRDFLITTGFNYAYRADGVSVWQPDSYASGASSHLRHWMTSI
jgi:hypothetical protein